MTGWRRHFVNWWQSFIILADRQGISMNSIEVKCDRSKTKRHRLICVYSVRHHSFRHNLNLKWMGQDFSGGKRQNEEKIYTNESLSDTNWDIPWLVSCLSTEIQLINQNIEMYQMPSIKIVANPLTRFRRKFSIPLVGYFHISCYDWIHFNGILSKPISVFNRFEWSLRGNNYAHYESQWLCTICSSILPISFILMSFHPFSFIFLVRVVCILLPLLPFQSL